VRQRPLIWLGNSMFVTGDVNRMILHFPEPADLILGQGLYHPGLGRVMKYAEGVPESLRKGILKVHSIAFLKGRGCWAKIENVTDQRMTRQEGPTQSMYVGDRIIRDGNDKVQYTIFEPHQTQWHKTWFIFDMITRALYPSKRMSTTTGSQARPALVQPIDEKTTTGALNDGFTVLDGDFHNHLEITSCIRAWAVLHSYSGTNVIHDAILSCLDGLTPTLKDCHGGGNSEPLACVDLSISYTQGKPADGLKPVSNQDLKELDLNPYYKPYQIRRLMRHGGVKEFIKMATGTDCKSMVKVMAIHLLEIPKMTIAVSMIISAFDGTSSNAGCYGTARIELLNALPLVSRFTINHRVRLVGILFSSRHYNKFANIPSIVRVFNDFNITKILDKMEEHDKLSSHILPEDVVAYQGCLSLITDTGNMLLQADRLMEKPTDRQKKFFPNGIVPKKWKTIQELHDDVSRKFTKYKTLGESRRIDWHEKVQSLHGSSAGGLRILLPRTKQTVAKWGALQDHCIASYADQMCSGDNTLFGVYQGKDLLYCGRIDKSENPSRVTDGSVNPGFWRLTELRGLKNKDATISDTSKIVQILYDNGIDIDTWLAQGYGGVPNGFEKTKSPTVEVKKPEIVVKNFTKPAIEAIV
jgi:hypothetical protein